jgi:hypothetical protein
MTVVTYANLLLEGSRFAHPSYLSIVSLLLVLGTLKSDPPEGRAWRFNLEEDALSEEEAQAIDERARQARRKIRSACRGKPRGSFVFGGPLEQWCLAAGLPGKALAVWQLVRHQVRLRGTLQVTLPAHLLSKAGVSKWALQRALKALERIGMLSVLRSSGRSPRITLIDLPEDQEDPCDQS